MTSSWPPRSRRLPVAVAGRYLTALVCYALGATVPEELAAQRLAGPRLAGPQPELRLDAIASRAPTLQVGVGANVPAGLYARIGLTAAAGVARKQNRTLGAARIDLTSRFLFDPLTESRFGLYAWGGVSAMYDGFEGWRPRLVAGLGLEGRPTHRTVPSLELALGGGARVALVVRKARPGRR